MSLTKELRNAVRESKAPKPGVRADTAGFNSGAAETGAREDVAYRGRASFWLTRSPDPEAPDGYMYEGPGTEPWEIGAV